jgi:AraC-like DNA-binding protein
MIYATQKLIHSTFLFAEVIGVLIHSMAMNCVQGQRFFIHRPSGSGDELLLIFKTDAVLYLDGQEHVLRKNSAVLFAKDTPQKYGAYEDKNYTDHFIHFECDENDPFFSMKSIKFDIPLEIPSIYEVENIMSLLSSEWMRRTDSAQASCELLLRLLLLKLFDTSAEADDSEYSVPLRNLRARIYTSPSTRYTVESLAKELSLSVSYFQSLYRKAFGVSCYEDVLQARQKLAEYYLEKTQLPVKRIAELCGFDNEEHFMRHFKSRSG